MNDFIAMSCPNCGGKLNVSPNTTTLICQNCGTEHMVRRQSGSVLLESFARCPQCNRNDRVQKISAILASHHNSGLIQILSPPSRPTLPPQPILVEKPFKSALETITVSSALGLFGLFCIGLVFSGIGNDQGSECLVFPLGIFLCIVAIVNMYKNLYREPSLRKKGREEYNRNLAKWKVLAQYQNIAIDEWTRFMQHWDKLYYCSRDDCVFIPNTNTFAPSSSMIEYLKKMFLYI